MEVSRTLKLKFYRLNAVKAQLFAETTIACTELANELLKLPIKERKKLTTAQVITSLKSALSNQVIRQVKGKAGKKTKEFKLLPPEINYQNWKLIKKGNTYSVSFPPIQGVKRVPIEIKSNHWQSLLDRLLARDKSITKGTLKLYQKKGKWYALVSLTEEVPEVKSNNRIGIDRGQNLLATAVPKQRFGLLFSGKEVKHRRRYFQQRRQRLQKAKKYRAIKKLEQKEQHYTSKTSSVNGIIGKRNGNWFECTSGAILQSDFNSGRNLAIWDNRVCSIDSRKAAGVMPLANLSDGVIGSPPNLVNAVKGRQCGLGGFPHEQLPLRREYVQLSLFDSTYN